MRNNCDAIKQLNYCTDHVCTWGGIISGVEVVVDCRAHYNQLQCHTRQNQWWDNVAQCTNLGVRP